MVTLFSLSIRQHCKAASASYGLRSWFRVALMKFQRISRRRLRFFLAERILGGDTRHFARQIMAPAKIM